MTSEVDYDEAFVWIWLPGETAPVVAGRLARVPGKVEQQFVFNYGRSYLARKNAIPIYEPELPLKPGALPLLNGLAMPNSIRDAAPDAWAAASSSTASSATRKRGAALDTGELNEIACLLESGSDRVGALDFQRSPSTYTPRETATASLSDLLDAADSVERGVPLNAELDAALLHGSSIGGARPKAMITAKDRKFVAKFSSQNDLFSVVKAEFIAMRLAAEVGLNVAPVEMHEVAGKDVLIITRFDREKKSGGWHRRAMVSALTMLALDELMARYASYEDLATVVRHRFTAPRETLAELFSRMLFNVLCGNTDDHARNHAAFWDGRALSLTPAYDICPQARSGNEATQAMLITGEERMSRIDVCLRAAPSFLLSRDQAIAIARRQVEVIRESGPRSARRQHERGRPQFLLAAPVPQSICL